MRRGEWKLIRFYADNSDGSDRFELYNLADDVGESRNLAAQRPELVAELNGLIDGFLRDTEAVIPVLNPAYDVKAVAAAAGPMQGWVARGCDAAVKQGIATVKGTGPTPFLGVGIAGDGPAVVSLRVKTASPGEGRIEWLNPKDPAVAPKSVPFALPGGDWQDITVNVPAEGRFGILRVYLPAANQPVDVDWIEFGHGKQAALRRWDF